MSLIDRDALAQALGDAWVERPYYVHQQDDFASTADDIIAYLTPIIAQLQMEIWDQGYAAGHSRAMRLMSDEPNVEMGLNPYRSRT